MKKKLLVIVAMMLTVATLATLVGTVSAAEDTSAAKEAYLYAYYSDKVVLDGNATQDGAEGTVGNMGAATEYDSDAGSGEAHFMEYVFDTVSGVKIAATWNDTTDVLYLAVPATITALEVEIGGKTLTIDRAALTVAGIDGAEVKKGDIYEIAIPMNKTLELAYDGMYVVTDLKVTTDAGTFDGKLAFTSNVPIIVFGDGVSYRAKNIKAPDDLKITTRSDAGRYYRHWILLSEQVDGGYKLNPTYTEEQLNAKTSKDARAGCLLYGYDPMYGDVADAETYVLKANIKIEGLPAVENEAAIITSRDIIAGGLKYDESMPHVTFYVANNANAAGAIMNCGAIFNTENGLKMVISTFVGNGTVIDLGKEVGDTFELKIINNVVKFNPETKKIIDDKENYAFEVYVDDVKVGEALNKQVKGSKISEFGFGFNVISNMQDFARNADTSTSSVSGYQWDEGGLYITEFVSSYEKTYDIEALAALSATTLEVEATNRFLKEEKPQDPPKDPQPQDPQKPQEPQEPNEPQKPTDGGNKAPTTDNANTSGEEEKGGCGSSVAGIGLVAVLGSALTAVVATKKKED